MKYIYILALVFSLILTGCRDNQDPVPAGPKEVKQMTLVYAVNRNNLSYDLTVNEDQMLMAMRNIDPDVYKLLVYKFTSDGPGLFEVRKNGENLEFSLLKRYDKSIFSIEKERVSEVLDDALAFYPDVESNLFFWGHGLGWVNPNKYSDRVESVTSATIPELYGFGGEYIYEDDVKIKTDYIDLDELAAAIPDGKFDMIWFDCCYMSSIEVAYQLKDKCDIYVAYPTEIMAEGLPYNLVLPKILGNMPDRVGAARAMYEYYVGKNYPDPVTIAVMDMSSIESVADAVRNIVFSGEERPSVSNLQNYSRLRNTPYYDFGQYYREYVNANRSSFSSVADADGILKDLNTAISKFVIYSAASDTDFSGRPINKNNFSGVSVHNFLDVDSPRDGYYRKLDWYKRIWGGIEAE